ncbi:MAG: DUF5658 family protein [Planctomycetaceae bacterium]
MTAAPRLLAGRRGTESIGCVKHHCGGTSDRAVDPPGNGIDDQFGISVMSERGDQPGSTESEPTYRLAHSVEPASRERTPVAPAGNLWKKFLLGQLPLEAETSYFILANLLDFFVTYWLLMAGSAGELRFIESNPVARYFIESWGPVKGMLGFKLTIVTLVCVISQIVALKRKDLARLVLLFGTLATGGVVVYSIWLYLRHA